MKVKLFAVLAFIIAFVLGAFFMHMMRPEIECCGAIGLMTGLFAGIVTNGFLTPLPEGNDEKENKEK